MAGYFGENTDGDGHAGQLASVYQCMRFQNTVGTGTLTEVGVNVNTGHAYTGSVRLGVYADTGSPTQPGALLLDAGEIVNPAGGWNSKTGLTLSVTDQLYYWLVVVSSTDSPGYFTANRNSALYDRFSVTQAYGVLVDPAPTYSGADQGLCLRAYVETAGTTLALTGVSGTASVGAVALSLALALSGVLGTGSVGTLAPSADIAASGIEAPASVGTMPPNMEAIAAGIEALGEAGTANPGVTVALTGNAATGAVGTVTAQIGVGPDITIPITGVSAGPAYPLSGVLGTGGTGTVTPVEATDITLPLTGIAGTGAVGNVVYLALGGWAATGEIGTVTPNVSPPVTSNEAVAAVGDVTQDRSVGLGGVSANGVAGGWSGFSRPLTGAEGAGVVGTLIPVVTKAITGNAAATARGSVVQSHDVALTGAAGTGVAGYMDTLIAGDVIRPLTGVLATAHVGTLTCGAVTPRLKKIPPIKRIFRPKPTTRIVRVKGG